MSAERPDTESTDEVTCPYCAHEFRDSWEFNTQEEDEEVECDSCGKTFSLAVNHSVSYTTTRLDCEDQAKEHAWGIPYKYDYDAEWIAKKHLENPRLYKADEKPHTLWLRDCENCDESDGSNLDLGAPCPWAALEASGA